MDRPRAGRVSAPVWARFLRRRFLSTAGFSCGRPDELRGERQGRRNSLARPAAPPGAFGLSGDFFARAAPLRPRPQVRGGCSGLQDPLAESNGDQGQSTPEQARRRFGRRGRARLERALTSGNGWGGVDSNHRPADYESSHGTPDDLDE